MSRRSARLRKNKEIMVFDIDADKDFEPSPKKNKRIGVRKRKSNHGLQRSNPQNKPVVVSLDVTYSSESEDEESLSTNCNELVNGSRCAPRRTDQAQCKESEPIITISDSENDDALPSSLPFFPMHNDDESPILSSFSEYDDSDEDDIYGINVEKMRENIFREASKKLEEWQKEEFSVRSSTQDELSDVITLDDNSLCSSPVPKENSFEILNSRSRKRKGRGKLSDNIPMSEIETEISGPHLSRSGRKRAKEADQALKSLKAFLKRVDDDQDCVLAINNSLDDIVELKDDHLTQISFFLRWGVKSTRQTIQKGSNFVNLYQKLAVEHGVSVSEIVLSFKDTVISPDQCPGDIGLSFMDTIDGGISRSSFSPEADSKTTEPTNDTVKNANEISLRIQTSNRKVVHTLFINKYDRLSSLMENYSVLRTIPLSRLKFMFDGEVLSPEDTSADLEFEGGECIDVYEQ